MHSYEYYDAGESKSIEYNIITSENGNIGERLLPLNIVLGNRINMNGNHVNDNPVNGNHVNDNPVNDNPVNDNPVNDNPVNDNQVHDNPVHDNPVNDNPVHDNPVNDNPVNDNPVHDNPVNDNHVNINDVEDDHLHHYQGGRVFDNYDEFQHQYPEGHLYDNGVGVDVNRGYIRLIDFIREHSAAIDFLSYGLAQINAYNYFENANEIFKSIIGNSLDAIASYNYCCRYILGRYNDFVGRFTDEYITLFTDILYSNQNEVIINMEEQHFDFFTNIMNPIIMSLNDNIIQEKKMRAVQILQKYLAPSGSETDAVCTTCIECINNSKRVVFPCNHEHHYDCILEWFYTKHICPNCRIAVE